MNIIQKQADDFIRFKMREHRPYKDFIDDVKSALWEYKKVKYQIQFIERVIQIAKIQYDKHMPDCKNPDTCDTNKFYENTMFFLQEELEELESDIDSSEFSRTERNTINDVLQTIIDDINLLKQGQEITYDDFKEEFEELKDLYYLNKKNWLQLFAGKLTNMVAGGMISETVSKDLVEIISSNYEELIAK